MSFIHHFYLLNSCLCLYNEGNNYRNTVVIYKKPTASYNGEKVCRFIYKEKAGLLQPKTLSQPPKPTLLYFRAPIKILWGRGVNLHQKVSKVSQGLYHWTGN